MNEMFDLFTAIFRGFINSIFTLIGIYIVAFIIWTIWSIRKPDDAPKRFITNTSLSENQDMLIVIPAIIIVLTFVYTLVHINN